MPDDGINRSDLKLEWALKFAALGFRIFPLRAGAKEPVAGESWEKIATTDADTITEWFVADPDANYAVNPDDRHVVIDVDTKKGKAGDTRLRDLEEKQAFDELISVSAFSVRTPSGGIHYYLKAPFAASNSHHFGSGIDVRGPGGYVVGPGCELVAGKCDPKDTPGSYSVEAETDVMQAPPWVVNLLKRQGEKDEQASDPIFDNLDNANAVASATTYIRNRRPAIEGQEGDKHTLVTAMGLMDFGLSPQKALDLMLAPLIKIKDEVVSWNDTCEPPWGVHELERKVENADSYRQTRPGSKGSDAAALDEAMARALALAGVDPDAPPPLSKWASIYYQANAVFARDTRRESIIPDVLPAHGISAIIAKRGGGKSAIMIDMALRIAHAADMDWHGHPIDKGRHVVYVCGEDDLGATEMIRAWCLEHDIKELPERFHFFAGIMDLLRPDDCEAFTRFVLDRIGDGQAVTFFDTWQRATTGAGQSDDEEMQRAWGNAEAIAKSLRGPGVIACHPPKDDRLTIMGSSVLENSSEALWTLEEKSRNRHFVVTRIKGAGVGLWIDFKFKVTPLGEYDRFGRERTGIVALKEAGQEGEKQTDANISVERETYAKVINAIDLDRVDIRYNEKGRLHYNVAEMADRIAGLVAISKEHDHGTPTDHAMWAKRLIVLLKDGAKLENFSVKPLAERLYELFKNQQYGVDIDGKHVVVLRIKGNKGTPRFYTETIVMAKLDTALDSNGN